MTNPDLIVRSCDLYSSADKERDTLVMYHYTAWSHKSAPSDVDHVADMYQNMLASRLQQTVSSVSELEPGSQYDAGPYERRLP